MPLMVVCGFCTNTLRISSRLMFGLRGQSGHITMWGFEVTLAFPAQNAVPPTCFKMDLREFEWLSGPKSLKFLSNTSWI